MHGSMGSFAGWVFVVGVVELFAWGIRLGVKGLLAPHFPANAPADAPVPPPAQAAADAANEPDIEARWRDLEALRDLYRVA